MYRSLKPAIRPFTRVEYITRVLCSISLHSLQFYNFSLGETHHVFLLISHVHYHLLGVLNCRDMVRYRIIRIYTLWIGYVISNLEIYKYHLILFKFFHYNLDCSSFVSPFDRFYSNSGKFSNIRCIQM